MMRFAGLFNKDRKDREFQEELESHIQMHIEDNLRMGMTPAEARRQAMIQLGGLESTKEAYREQRGIPLLETLFQDLRYGARMLRKNPGFTTVAVLTVALGIGANTAIFSVTDRLLVRPLPVEKPERLALVGLQYGDRLAFGDFNYPLFRDFQRGNSGFSQLTATADFSVGLGDGGATEREHALLVSGNYFQMLGVDAALGRTYAQNEGVEIDDAPVIVLSHGLWRRQFGSDPQVIGRQVTVNSRVFTIIGVAPREFTGTTRGQVPDLYVPITMQGQLTAGQPGGENPLRTRYFMAYQILGRLKDDMSHPQAQASMQKLAQEIHAVTPVNTDTNIVVLSGAQGFAQGTREARLPLVLLLATAGLVLLIACANLANLQLARASTRSRDFAVRLALGAGRGRLMRGLLTESLLLSLLGGTLGVLVALWLTNLLVDFRVPGSSFELVGRPDGRVFAFAFIASLLTGVGFGLAPAWRASRTEIVPELKGAGRAESSHPRWSLRNALVVTQAGLSLLVLVGASLCVRSLQKLQRLDPGFEPSKVVLMSFDLGLNAYSGERAGLFSDQLLERIRALPGIEAASLATTTPLDGSRGGMSIDRLEGYEKKPDDHPSADVNQISSGFFRSLGVPMLAGRDFDGSDAGAGLKTVIINHAFAQRYWPGQNAVGKHLYQGEWAGSQGGAWEIVGVARDVTSRRVQDAPRPMMFRPLAQWPAKALTLSVKTAVGPSAVIPMLRGLVKSLDANVPVFNVRTLEQQKDGTLALQRMAALLLSGFGALALLLAALGTYGVLAYSVSRRTREIGVRMALGATIADVLTLVMRQGLALVVVGMALGLVGALALTRLLRGFLYEITALDPLSFASALVLLGVVSVLACWLPARRAARVDPMVALRHE
ncbi:MAG: ADOP family duplicated permease [Limisphaerales bacterium]